MAQSREVGYAWKTAETEGPFDDISKALFAMNYILTQVRILPPTAQVVTPLEFIDAGEQQDVDGTPIHIYAWHAVYSVPDGG